MSKFLFVIPTLSMGGAERVVAVLSSALVRCGEEVCVLKYYEKENEYPVGDGVKVMNLSGEGEKAYKQISVMKRIRLLRQTIKQIKPDYVLPFLFPVAQAVFFATAGINTNVFQSIRISPAVAPSSKVQRFFRDRLVYRSRCAFVQNEQQRQYFKPSARNKIHVLYNPVSDDLFEVVPEFSNDVYTVCTAGRLENQKNFKLLIEAFAQAFVSNDKVVLQIYGEGNRKEELQDYIADKGMANRIMLMGRTNNIKEVYRKSDLFVLSSDYEGMPNALLEAMACGLPCVSTDCPTGPSDLIDNEVNGLLVPIRDSQKLSQAILFMYEHPKEAREMGVEARESIRRKCQADNIARKLIEICEASNNKRK